MQNNNGWTEERRKQQALSIQRWQPWKNSTGAKTDSGKAIAKMNAFKHGARSLAFVEVRKQLVQLTQNDSRY